MRTADIPYLVKLTEETMPYPWSERVFQDCFQPGYYGWVISRKNKHDQGDEISGYIIVLIQVDECHILNICVKKERQSSGDGRQLIEWVINFAQNHHLKKLILEVRRSNKNAIGFYQHLGFIEVGVRYKYYKADNGLEDALIFTLT